jgi:hypothetical protein
VAPRKRCTDERFSRIALVRGASKKLVAVLAALLLAAALAACGGGDSSSSTTTEAAGKGQAEGQPTDAASKQPGKSGSEGKSEGSAGGGGQSKSSGSSNFVPKHHEDSGGGSKQFRVKGGDNSIQEFGGEADTSELDAAAAVLHDFLDARAAGDWTAACKYMSKRVIESFNNEITSQSKPGGKLGCATVLEALINPAAKQSMKAEAAQADVRSLRIEGEHAFAIYTAVGNTALAMPMENEAGAWKVASIAGTPLT